MHRFRFLCRLGQEDRPDIAAFRKLGCLTEMRKTARRAPTTCRSYQWRHIEYDAHRKATLVGFVAVLLWALTWRCLPLARSPYLRFNLTAMSLHNWGNSSALIWIIWSGELTACCAKFQLARVSVSARWGYLAITRSISRPLRMAPAAEAGLIAYLWPLLIVSVFWHVAG